HLSGLHRHRAQPRALGHRAGTQADRHAAAPARGPGERPRRRARDPVRQREPFHQRRGDRRRRRLRALMDSPLSDFGGRPAEAPPRRGPPVSGVGLAAGLGAGAFWGSTFVAPVVLPEFGTVDLTVGRFLACGLLSLVLLLVAALRGKARWPRPSQAAAALALSLLGYTGYDLLLVLAVQAAGAAVPVLIIGTSPLWLVLLGKRAGLRWRSLLPGLLLTAAGIAVMVAAGGHGGEGGAGA